MWQTLRNDAVGCTGSMHAQSHTQYKALRAFHKFLTCLSQAVKTNKALSFFFLVNTKLSLLSMVSSQYTKINQVLRTIYQIFMKKKEIQRQISFKWFIFCFGYNYWRIFISFLAGKSYIFMTFISWFCFLSHRIFSKNNIYICMETTLFPNK